MLSVHETPAELAEAAAQEIAALLDAAVATRGGALFLLAGGSTPRALYRLLAAPPLADALDWRGVAFYMGDERCVPPEHEASNFRMARESLLSPLRVRADAVHRIRGEFPPEEGAERYDAELRAAADGGIPRFDVALLGLGRDGHTASLFPGAPALAETRRLASAALAPEPPRARVTVTLPLLGAARAALFVVSGAEKAPALARALQPGAAELVPAALVQPTDGALRWLVDRAAAASLETPQ